MKMENKKTKTPKGLVSFVTVILLLSFILALSLTYENAITANVARETSTDAETTSILVKEVDDVKELNQLNEGWYQIINGYVYYLESFDSYVFLYIKIKNPDERNGLLVVDADGNIKFDETFRELPRREVVVYEEKNVENKETKENEENQITGKVTGLERVSGFVTTECFSSDGRQKLQICPSVTTAHIKLITRDDGIRIKEVYNGQSNTPMEKSWAPRNNPNNFVAGEPPPAPPTAPRAPITPLLPAPEPEKVPFERPTLANDGWWYYRFRDGRLMYYDETEGWTMVEKTFYVNVRDKKGETKVINIEAPTEKLAREQLQKEGFNVIGVSTKSLEEARVTGNFVVKEFDDGTKYVTNGKDAYIPPSGKTAEGYARDLNDEARINDEYKRWLQNSGRQDTPKNKELFNKYPPEGVNRELIPKVLGITPIQREDAKKEQLKIETIQLPNGQFLFVHEGKEYIGNEKERYPLELQGILNFKEKHLTAVLQAGFKTKDDRNVYLEKGKFIDETGRDISEATKKEKIGENEYDVTYKFEGGKKIPAKIKIEDKEANIDDGSLQSLKSNVGKEDKLSIRDRTIVVEKKSIFKEGKEGTDNYREIITEKNLIYYSGEVGTFTSESLITTKDKDGNIIELKALTQVYDYNKERNQYVPHRTTEKNYRKKESEASIDADSSDYTEILTDPLTGEPLAIRIRENNVQFDATYRDGVYHGDEKAKQELYNLHSQYTVRQFFANVERVLTEFRGLGYYATLFFDEDSLLAWRDNVDRAFATLYLGIEYISSGLCSTYIDGEDEGIAYAETPQGLAQIGAHIEATRTQEIQTDKGREFIYKITFSIRNGDFAKDPRAPEEMNFNVVLRGERTVNVFRQEQEVKRGSTFSRTGRSAIVQDSTALFTQICIVFDETPLRWKLDDDELCNSIVESSEEATSLVTPSGTVPSSGGAGATESEINDF